MFGNLGVHVNKFPSGRWGFVGTLPVALANVGPASFSDSLAGRSFTDEAGNLMAYQFPSFESEAEARNHAAERGVTLSN